MILVNTDYITGKAIKMLGFVEGVVLHQGGMGGATGTYGVSSLKAMSGAGGDLLTSMLEKARDDAKKALKEEAKKLNADAIVNIKYSAAEISEGVVEIMYTGTAVKYIKIASKDY